MAKATSLGKAQTKAIEFALKTGKEIEKLQLGAQEDIEDVLENQGEPRQSHVEMVAEVGTADALGLLDELKFISRPFFFTRHVVLVTESNSRL